MLPHITLLTGDLVPSQTWEALARATEHLARQVKPLTLQLDPPHLCPLKGRFVWCDIRENPALNELRAMVRENLLDTYLTTPFPCPRPPHITLAHIYRRQEKVGAYLDAIDGLPQAVCARIEVSRVGPLGTCLDRLVALPEHELTKNRHRQHSTSHVLHT